MLLEYINKNTMSTSSSSISTKASPSNGYVPIPYSL